MARLSFRLKPSEETKQHTSFIKSLDESEVNPANTAKVDESCVDSVNDNHVGKHVSFVALHIRQHSVTLGDHPCCTLGLPVALDWNIEKEFSMNLDDYESTRERRKSRLELRLSSEDRLELLSDVSEQEIKRANRKLQRERQQCRNPCDRTFFDQVEPQITIARGSSE